MVGTHLPASVLPGLLEIALRGRLDAATLFERAGVDPGADRYLTLDQLDRLLGTVFRDAGDPCSDCAPAAAMTTAACSCSAG